MLKFPQRQDSNHCITVEQLNSRCLNCTAADVALCSSLGMFSISIINNHSKFIFLDISKILFLVVLGSHQVVLREPCSARI